MTLSPPAIDADSFGSCPIPQSTYDRILAQPMAVRRRADRRAHPPNFRSRIWQ